MAYNTGDLNGSGPFYIRLDVNYNGRQYNNGSEFDWAVYMGCSSNGWGTFGIGGTVSVNIGGNVWSGSLPNPDFRPSGSSARMILVAVGTWWIGHDGNGNRPGFENSASIDSDHGSVGDGWVAGVWVDAPRIPKLPAAPTPVGLNQITPTTMRYQFSGNDDGGSQILEWQAQLDDDASFASPITLSSSGTSTFVDLRPGTLHHARSRGRNAVGWGPWSSVISAATLPGGRVKVGGVWKNAIPFVKVGGVWKQAQPFVKVGGVWKPTS